MTIKERIFFFIEENNKCYLFISIEIEILHKKKKVKIEHVKEGQKVRSTVKRD